MNNFSDAQQLESYVPVYDAVPDKWEDARPFVVEQLKRLANAVNIREIGWFIDEEVLSGKAFIPGLNNAADGGTSQQYRQILRKVIDFGPLPAAAIKAVPHGITVDANFTLVQIYGAATDPITFQSIPIPFSTPNALNQNILLSMDAFNVNVVVGINFSNFTRCFITIEYLQEL